MNKTVSYILDSDVFITAKNHYYAFAICPGFWDCLIHFHTKVRSRILLPNICDQFNVDRKNTFEMLHDLKVRLEWGGELVW